MKLDRILILLVIAASPHLGSAQIMPDSLWICRDVIPDTELMFYFQIGLCDTPVLNTGCWNATLNSPGVITMADTGSRWDSSYINFNYQFTNAKTGYAGFKIFWDNGFVAFDARSYDSLYFVHKGPLPGHKVKMIWGQGGQCGGPILYEEMGEFKPSATWTKTTVPFPKLRGNYPQNQFPDSPFVKVGIFELRILIYNDSSVTTSPTSAPGGLKLDNICFIRAKKIVKPAAPTPVSPSNNAAGVSVTPAIMWSGPSGATSYSLQVATLSDFSSFVVNRNNITATTFNASGLTNSTKYYWRVNATTAAGISDWSTAWNFTTISPLPTAPSIVFPVSGAINVPIDPVMVWHSVANAVSYKVQVSTTPDFIMLVKYMTVPADTSAIVTGLAKGTKYYSRVNAESTGGTGNWSTAVEFTTVAANVDILSGQTRPLSFSCNGSSIAIRYSLPGECFVSLNYYDVRGAEVASFVNQVRKPGSYSLSPPFSTWARGTYIQIFRAGSFIKKDMVAVIR